APAGKSVGASATSTATEVAIQLSTVATTSRIFRLLILNRRLHFLAIAQIRDADFIALPVLQREVGAKLRVIGQGALAVDLDDHVGGLETRFAGGAAVHDEADAIRKPVGREVEHLPVLFRQRFAEEADVGLP